MSPVGVVFPRSLVGRGLGRNVPGPEARGSILASLTRRQFLGRFGVAAAGSMSLAAEDPAALLGLDSQQPLPGSTFDSEVATAGSTWP